jgi:hypothetical protein
MTKLIKAETGDWDNPSGAAPLSDHGRKIR